jgi:hypothetical protein
VKLENLLLPVGLLAVVAICLGGSAYAIAFFAGECYCCSLARKQPHSVPLLGTGHRSDATRNATLDTLVIVETQSCDLLTNASAQVEYSGSWFLCNVGVHERCTPAWRQ